MQFWESEKLIRHLMENGEVDRTAAEEFSLIIKKFLSIYQTVALAFYWDCYDEEGKRLVAVDNVGEDYVELYILTMDYLAVQIEKFV